MSSDQKRNRDAVIDLILGAALKVSGVGQGTVRRTEAGYRLTILPESGIDRTLLRQALYKAEEETVPLLASDIEILIGPEKPEDTEDLFKTRISVERANVHSLKNGGCSVTVGLSRSMDPSKELQKAECSRSGAYLTDNIIRLAAEATLNAALELSPEIKDGAVIGTECLNISEDSIIVVLLTLIFNTGKINVSGASCIRNEVHIAAIIATLRSINRFLEFTEEG